MAVLEDAKEAGEVESIKPMWEYLTPDLLKSLGPEQIGRTPKAQSAAPGNSSSD
jgi:hypothetical protein